MAKRLFDVVVSIVVLVICAPLLALAALGIRLTSPGPILYRASRAGLGGAPFTMFKLRTMNVDHGSFRSAITADNDPRVFPLGRLLRRLRIDELPQLLNVIRGDMSLVGPRPEDTKIVSECYRPEHMITLKVRPGLASPGSIYNYTHERLLKGSNAQDVYVESILPVKLALDAIYCRQPSFAYDLRIIFRAIWTAINATLGKQTFADPPEMKEALSSWANRTNADLLA